MSDQDKSSPGGAPIPETCALPETLGHHHPFQRIKIRGTYACGGTCEEDFAGDVADSAWMRLGDKSSRTPKKLGDVAVEFWLQTMLDRRRETGAAEVPCAPAPEHGETVCNDLFPRQVEHARAAHGAHRAVGDVPGEIAMGLTETINAARVGRQRAHGGSRGAGASLVPYVLP